MIEIRGLTHRYADGTTAVRNIDLTIPDGEFLLLCGPNGSGKTTLIRHLNGLLRPSSGSVVIDGVDVVRSPREARRKVGMVFQDADSQIVGETVEEDVAFGPENLGLEPPEVSLQVRRALERVELDRAAHKSCHFLSGGEKRRLAIAGVLAMDPPIIVCDEPFANLDYSGTRRVLEQLLALKREGRTLVLTTHDVEKAVAHADRIAVLQDGRLETAGPCDAVVPELSRYGIRPPCYALLGAGAISWLND